MKTGLHPHPAPPTPPAHTPTDHTSWAPDGDPTSHTTMAGHGRAVARVWAKESLAWVGCDFMVLFHMFHFLHCIYGTILLFPLTPSVFLHAIRAAALYLIIKMFDNVRIYI